MIKSLTYLCPESTLQLPTLNFMLQTYWFQSPEYNDIYYSCDLFSVFPATYPSC